MSEGYLSKDREHLAKLQRQRRARQRRIDYYPSPQALAAIEVLRSMYRPGSQAATNSAVIDAIVTEWADATGINCSPIDDPMTPASGPELTDTFARAYDFGAIANKAKQSHRVTCGAARHRDGLPCQAMSEPGKRRCRFHGGKSTGPRTADGKARARANLCQYRSKRNPT